MSAGRGQSPTSRCIRIRSGHTNLATSNPDDQTRNLHGLSPWETVVEKGKLAFI